MLGLAVLQGRPVPAELVAAGARACDSSLSPPACAGGLRLPGAAMPSTPS